VNKFTNLQRKSNDYHASIIRWPLIAIMYRR